MLAVDFSWVDVTESLRRSVQPIMVLERSPIHTQGKAWSGPSEVARTGEFVVPDSPVTDNVIKWVTTVSGNFVRVPLHAYKTNVPDSVSALFGLGLQLGLQAAGQLAQQKIVPIHVTLVLGHECHRMADGIYRGYVGFSFRTK